MGVEGEVRQRASSPAGWPRSTTSAAATRLERLDEHLDYPTRYGRAHEAARVVRRYLDAGATDIRVSPAAFATDEERLRTWRLARAAAS